MKNCRNTIRILILFIFYFTSLECKLYLQLVFLNACKQNKYLILDFRRADNFNWVRFIIAPFLNFETKDRRARSCIHSLQACFFTFKFNQTTNTAYHTIYQCLLYVAWSPCKAVEIMKCKRPSTGNWTNKSASIFRYV